ncbi:MAG: cytochrome c biogenesis protein CcdA [Candidatus Paceibacterota bacterium]|jgi:cytochrome c biogenesis protein CcdA
MEILVGTSLVAAFVAGVAALFAPCCVSVLLPSYLGNVFKEKYKIFFMTFVFFLGMATVFLPIGLGASMLSQTFSKYHSQIFTVGGIFLMVLGIFMLFGKKMTTPASVRDGMKKHVSSIYVLGIFSAIATTCCAPVLAGVLTLSVASGTVIWGVIYTLAYVLGMTLPLFIIAALLDKYNLTEKIKGAKKIVAMRLGSFKWRITVSELISSLIFLAMGGYITYLAFANKLTMHPSDYQLQMNIYNAKFLGAIQGYVKIIPEYIWALIFVLIVSYMSFAFIKLIKKQNNEKI